MARNLATIGTSIALAATSATLTFTAPAEGDGLWREAKRYTASIARAYEQALNKLAEAKDYLVTAEQLLLALRADAAAVAGSVPPALAAKILAAEGALATAQAGVAAAGKAVLVAAAAATAFAAGTGIGQGADYLISWCWDPVCPLETATGLYWYPTDGEIDPWIQDVITNATGTPLTQADFAAADAVVPGAGTASWNYLRSGSRMFSIAMRGAGAFSVNNCPDVHQARGDLDVAIDEFEASLVDFTDHLSVLQTYNGNPSADIAAAHAALDELQVDVNQFPDPGVVQTIIDESRAVLIGAQAAIDSVSNVNGDPRRSGFDQMAPGPLAGQDGWCTWGNDPALDAFVAPAQPRGGQHALQIDGPADVVLPMPSFDEGAWSVSAWQYIPSNFDSGSAQPEAGSYFILLNTYAHAGPYHWSAQMQFDSNDGLLKVLHGDGTNTIDVPYIVDRWVKIQTVVDLENDWTQIYYDDQLVTEYAWTGGVLGDGGGALDIAAIDLFANGSSPIFYDDMVIERLDAPDRLPQQVDGEQGVLPPYSVDEYLQFLDDCQNFGAAALPPMEIAAVNTLLGHLDGTYAGQPDLAPPIAAWDGLGDTSNEAALFQPTGFMSNSDLLTSAIDHHWNLINLDQSPLIIACNPCPGDVDYSGDVGFNDILVVLSSWGPCPPPCDADTDGDGIVDFVDLLNVLSNWGPCD